ncbi:MAG TPA: hypothetical protein VLW50_22185 [Streptosporangiaceae bacterium]|nr:hypothetical protein [Streptosporangiaceae bacterium]
MSLITKNRHDETVSPAAVERARQAAQQAAQQLAPVAKSARDNAAHRIHDARAWAAPRVEQAASSVQENVAPKVSAALQVTAQRLQPAPEELKELGRRARRRALAASQQVSAQRSKALAKSDQPKRRWPKLIGGVAFLAATIGAITAVAVRRNKERMEADLDDAAFAAAETEEGRADAEAGFDGQVRTP